MHRQTMMTIMRATASRQANRMGSQVDTGNAIKKIMLQVLTKTAKYFTRISQLNRTRTVKSH